MENVAEMRHRIGNLLAQKRDYRQELRELCDQHAYVIFYGCGAVFPYIVETWNKYIDRKIDFCCDSDPEKWGKVFCGLECIPSKELLLVQERCVVFVSSGYFVPISNYLMSNEFLSVCRIHVYDIIATDFLLETDPEEILNKLSDVYNILADQQSVRVFTSILDRVLVDTKSGVMKDVCEGDQYFPQGVIELSEHECLVDIGAYNGDTVRDFIKHTKGKFDSISCFELDKINFKLLQEAVGRLPHGGRIQTFNYGMWDSEREVDYIVCKTSSMIGPGNGRGYVYPLDSTFMRNKRVTFIKVDVEGAELNVLHGACNIIQNQKPKLAVCVYHNFQHLWEIPLYIKSLVPEYKIYLRHHTGLSYETVCYAVL